MRHLSLPDTILVAAAANGCAPERMLRGTDLTLLVLITGRARAATTTADAAAAFLVGVAAGRPFSLGNDVAAWALAAHVATVNRRRLDTSPAAACALLAEASSGSTDEARVAARLRPSISVRPGRARRLVTTMFEVPPAPPAIDWACPECGRTVPEPPHRSSAFLWKPLPDDVVRDCAVRHRAHGPTGTGHSTVLAPLRRATVLRRA